MNKKIILDLCGGTGAWSKPYSDAGYDVKIITLPETDIMNYDPFSWSYMKDIHGVLAAPPCTMFSLARTTAKKPRDLYEGMKTVDRCLKIIWNLRIHHKLAFWAIENPQGLLRQFLGKPAFTFDPSEFGGDYNKTTDLWGYFKTPKTLKDYKRFPSTDKNTRKLPSIPESYKKDPAMSSTAIRRSITNNLFAEAFFKANP